jgi:DNA-binding winged helix-turn-helix (wHTH) protein
MAVLVLMTSRTGQVVSRDELLERLWPNRVVTDDAVTRCFYMLRRQLSQAGGNRRYRAMIETLPKRGYRLNGAVASLKPPVADVSKPVDRRPLKIAVALGAATALILVIVSLGAG